MLKTEIDDLLRVLIEEDAGLTYSNLVTTPLRILSWKPPLFLPTNGQCDLTKTNVRVRAEQT